MTHTAIGRAATLGSGVNLEEDIAMELEAIEQPAAATDFTESVDAFLNKRVLKWLEA